ncbi:MAG: tRNA (adenosine(37)-N6)-dimethylallyltransferase MiaA [Dehalococcoidales bacterium]|nr:tRNA (adenosine(37)-N6)-dimethylallyltransferase MiaA [Dehalococcoidales bacterium]
MKKLVAITGPTGIGKSRIALEIAKKFTGEIISADSRQVYRLMDIGTAKPTAAERKEIPHHGIDIALPDEPFSLANFIDIAYREIDTAHNKGRLPILAGGTGQYIWAIIEGWEIPRIKPDITLRRELEKRALNGEMEILHKELERANPQAAARIDPRNVRRVIRALEIALTGKENSVQIENPRYNSLIIGLTAPRKRVYQMVDERVDQMIKNGLVEEVKNLIIAGYSSDLPAMSGIGYRQIARHLEGATSIEETIESIKNESHRLVRMQYNWFSLQDARIKWFDITQPDYTKTIIDEVKGFITN